MVILSEQFNLGKASVREIPDLVDEGRDGGVELTRLPRPINVFSGPSQFPMDYEHGGMGLHGVNWWLPYAWADGSLGGKGV